MLNTHLTTGFDIGRDITPSSEEPEPDTDPALPDWLVQGAHHRGRDAARRGRPPHRETGPGNLTHLHAHTPLTGNRPPLSAGPPGRLSRSTALRSPFTLLAAPRAADILGRLRGGGVAPDCGPPTPSTVRAESAESPQNAHFRPSTINHTQRYIRCSEIYGGRSAQVNNTAAIMSGMTPCSRVVLEYPCGVAPAFATEVTPHSQLTITIGCLLRR
jgi:hypothetical protein